MTTLRLYDNLSEARASQASARAASLITPIDVPDAGIKPVGPGRVVIALCGVFGGLLSGFGLVFLAIPTGTPTPQAEPVNGRALTGNGTAPWFLPSPKANGHLTFKQALQRVSSGR